jgi:RND family efflux transporter MFP subunit
MEAVEPPGPVPQSSDPAGAFPLLAKIAGVVAVSVGLGLLLLALAGFFQAKVPMNSVKVPGVDVSKLNLAEVRLIRRPRYESAVGTVKAVHEAAVASRLLTRVVEVKVKAGQPVQQGEVLLRLDDADLQARFKQADAALVSARATLENADGELTRAKQLLARQAISQQDYDRAATTFRTAQADVVRNEQAVHESKALLAYATIKSPLTGIVIDKKVEVGDTVTPGQTLVTVFNPDKMQMVASVRESLALRLTVGQKVPGRIESMHHECEATISEIVPESQASSRTFTVKVVGPCPPGVYSGMFGRIFIPLDDEEIIVVAGAAIKRVGQLEMVRVLQDGKLYRRNIQSGRTLGSDVEILAGLRPGEKSVLPTNGKEAQP